MSNKPTTAATGQPVMITPSPDQSEALNRLAGSLNLNLQQTVMTCLNRGLEEWMEDPAGKGPSNPAFEFGLVDNSKELCLGVGVFGNHQRGKTRPRHG